MNEINANTAHTPLESKGLTVLTPEDSFRFACHKGLACFTQCCRDTAVFLTPYDIIRLKNALGVSSQAFLEQYTQCLNNTEGIPMVLLKASNDRARSCPFVTAQGCTVYPHRPWSCRIFPLRPEVNPKTEKSGKQYYSIAKANFCLGLEESNVLTVAQWTAQQGIAIYQEMEKHFQKITMSEFVLQGKIENTNIRQMVYMACYDLDRFRRFVCESTFLKRFELDQTQIEEIKNDDVALYKLAMRWLEFGLVRQEALNVNPRILAGRQRKSQRRGEISAFQDAD